MLDNSTAWIPTPKPVYRVIWVADSITIYIQSTIVPTLRSAFVSVAWPKAMTIARIKGFFRLGFLHDPISVVVPTQEPYRAMWTADVMAFPCKRVRTHLLAVFDSRDEWLLMVSGTHKTKLVSLPLLYLSLFSLTGQETYNYTSRQRY
jgi:hypothetical protein